MPPAISIEHLSKAYRLGTIGSKTLSADVSRWWAAARGRPDPLLKIGQEHHERRVGQIFWALEDVTFAVERGDVVGIIGRNGAGKSTLLKILSQVTAPTSGRITVQGRIASLLEVGTGFHPELSGRENVFLNGAILGMTRAEIRKKFDEIVAFSECEEFIDTPVKRYSSGMHVRLAFAVAAHLEPEILIIDEVLAVGDAQFQKKCLGKMQDVGRQGRTVLFVSHTMSAITRLCSRAVLIGEGRVISNGPVSDVVAAYLNSGVGSAAIREWPSNGTAPGDGAVRLSAVRVIDGDGQVSHSLDIRKSIGISIEYDVIQPGTVMVPSLQIYNGEGVCVFSPHDWASEWRDAPRHVGRYRSTCWIPGNFMAEGTFFVNVAIATYKPFVKRASVLEAVAFEVVDSPDGSSARGDWAGHFPGVIRPILQWTTDVPSTLSDLD